MSVLDFWIFHLFAISVWAALLEPEDNRGATLQTVTGLCKCHHLVKEVGSLGVIVTTTKLFCWGGCSKPTILTMLGTKLWPHFFSFHFVIPYQYSKRNLWPKVSTTSGSGFSRMAQTDKHTNRQPDRPMDMATLDQLGTEGPVGEHFRRLTDLICQRHMQELHESTCPIL